MQILRKELNYSKQKSFSMLGAALFVVMVLWSMSLSAQKAYTISSGNNYLAHRYNTTTSGYELYTTRVFSDSCVWYSPNTNNYYFMSIDGTTRYYLSAAFATRTPPNATDATDSDLGAGAPLTIVAEDDAVRTLLGSNTSNYYFYNWDWGLAHGQQYEGGSCPSEFNSAGSECWRAYWLVYDNALGDSEPQWHMSTTSSYEPLEHIATFEPVRIIHHQVTAGAQTGGLSAISVGAITYGSSITPTATIGDYSDQITPEYTSLATGALDNCRGDWTVRVCDTIWTTHNFWPSMSYTNDHGTAEPPAVEHEYTLSDLTSSSYRWTLSGAGTAYLTISNETTATPTVAYSTSCYDASGSTATLTLTITWPDGSTQSATTVITIPQHLENPTAMTVAPSTMELVENGAAGELELTFTPTEHVNTTVNSVSSEIAIATASGTTVTPVSVGQTTVTVTSAVAPSVSGSVTVLVRPAAPTISYTMSNDQALVTITNNSSQCPAGQLQYKTGSGDWTNYSAAFLVNSGVEITARLLCTSCSTCGEGITSPEVKESPRVTSGVRGSYVILNDYEDHSWSYYSDPKCPIRSLNPVDVKITYYGNGTNNMTTTDVADNPTTFDADATGVKVGIAAGEDQSTFVYYKTLERLDGNGAESIDAANGPAEYTTIPNPFQVRPTGTNNGTVSVTPATRNVTLTWSCNNWTYGAWEGWNYTTYQATASFTYTNANGETVTSNTYTSNGNITVPVKTGTTITLKVKACREQNRYRPTITATYAEGTGSISSNSLTATNTTERTSTTGSIASQAVNVTYNEYRGFYAWRVKSAPTGGNVYRNSNETGAITTGAIINAETPIYFVPTNNDTKMGLELEALWAQAYVTTGSSNLGYTVPSYERNFHVVNAANQTASNYQKSYPLTISSRYPNGTSAGGSLAAGAFTAAADTKLENIAIANNNNDYTADGHSLIIGRGVTSTGYCAATLYGINANAGNVDMTLRVESGSWNNIYYAGQSNTYSGVVSIRGVLGSDFDRASGDNSKLTVQGNNTMNNGEYTNGQIYGGEQLTFSGAGNRNNITFDYNIKSGTLQGNRLGSARGDEAIYLGSSQAGNGNLRYIGKRRLIIEGGNMASIAAGMNNVSTDYGVNDGKWAVMVRMKGGTVRGSIYGAAAFAQAVGDRVMIFTGGTINGWVAGGCNGYKTGSGGTLNGDTKLYVGGETHIEHTNTDPQISTSWGGNVFGAGSGYSDQYDIGEVSNSTIVVSDNALVSKNVYGGGNYGYVADGGSSSIYIAGNATINGAVFGGANQRTGESVNIKMVGGNVQAGIYGGSNISGTVDGPVTISVTGGTVGISESSTANVHGGGFGNSTVVTGNIDIVIGHADSSATQPTIYGDVYGGSAMGTVNGTAYSSGRHTLVTVNQGLITGNGTTNTAKIKGDGTTNAQTFTATGSVYGGGLGTDSYAANVYAGTVKVTVNGGTMNRTFGANNANGLPYGSVETEITGGTIGNVYGGGNAAAYGAQTNNTTPKVTMTSGTVLHDVFGGGLGANARVTRDTRVDIKGTSVVNGNVFGGGSEAEVGNNTTGRNTLVNILGSARVDGNVYGGGNRAKVWGNTVVNVGE